MLNDRRRGTKTPVATPAAASGSLPDFKTAKNFIEIDRNFSISNDRERRLSTAESTRVVLNFNNSLTQLLEPYAIYGALFNSTINFIAAIRGDSLATTGGGNVVIGLTSSAGGGGIRGMSIEANGGGYGVIGRLGATSVSGVGEGVLGTTTLTTAFSTGVRGSASGTSGPGVGAFGESFSLDGVAASFVNWADGTILQRTSGGSRLFRVDNTGRSSETGASN